MRAESIAVAVRSHGDRQALGQDAILDCLILLYRAWRRPDLMETTARRRLELAEDESEDDLKFGAVLGNLSEALDKQERYADAAATCRAAILHYQRWFRNTLRAKRFQSPNTASSRASLRSSGNMQVAWLRHELARILREMGLTEEASRTERYAELALRRALAARDSEARPDNVGDISLLTGLAQVSVARGRLAAAEQLYRRALAIYEQVAQNQIARLNGPETARGRERMRAVLASSTGSVRREYAAVLRALGRPGETTLRGDFG